MFCLTHTFCAFCNLASARQMHLHILFHCVSFCLIHTLLHVPSTALHCQFSLCVLPQPFLMALCRTKACKSCAATPRSAGCSLCCVLQ